MPKTASDQIMLLFAFVTATLVWGGLAMGLQGRKVPPEFKDIALFLGGGVLQQSGSVLILPLNNNFKVIG